MGTLSIVKLGCMHKGYDISVFLTKYGKHYVFPLPFSRLDR
jgi:hypothetical protein